MKDSSKLCIVLLSDQNYLNYTAFLVSKLEKWNEHKIRIFVITDKVTESEFEKAFRGLNASQLFASDDYFAEHMLQAEGHVSATTYCKLLIPNLIPSDFETCLYLDTDIYVNGNPFDLFEQTLRRPIGAVEIKNPRSVTGENHDYFNAGVILMDLVRLRSQHYTEKFFSVLAENENLRYQEQDVFNIVFMNNWVKLPPKFNFMAEVELNFSHEFRNDSPVLVHLISARKPWKGYSHTKWHFLWRQEYFKFRPESLDRIRADVWVYRLIMKFSFSAVGQLVKKCFSRNFKDFYLNQIQRKNLDQPVPK